jgi:hypothetical protein
MKNATFIFLFTILTLGNAAAQPTFKAGFKTYNTWVIVHEYTFNYAPADSGRLTVTDSAITYIAPDSMVTMTECTHYRDKTRYKTVNYFGAKKLKMKCEEYKDDNLVEIDEWKYDDKNRKTTHFKDNRIKGNTYRNTYDYVVDKKTGESVVTESSYFNNKIEFYTKMYYDKKNVMYKEVRLNDNNRDIIHVETFTYGENGKVKERSVYFPEFKVTKKFDEPAGSIPAKCFAMMPVGTIEKVNLNTKIPYIKRVLAKNKAIINDTACKDYEYTFTNSINCTITIATSKNGKTVKYKYKEKV